MKKQTVLFVCLGNTCRSPLAQYIAQIHFHDFIIPDSAGVEVRDCNANDNTIKVMKNVYSYDISSHMPKSINSIDPYTYDNVIALDSYIYEYLYNRYPNLRPFKWEIPDPYQLTYDDYKITAENIFIRLKQFVVIELKNNGCINN